MALALIALIVSGHLTVDHYSSTSDVACSASGLMDCGLVTSSPQSEILGVPVALLGVGWALAMLVLSVPRLWYSDRRPVRTVRAVLAWSGIGAVAWFVYVELFLIRAICLWCSIVHVTALALFALSLVPARTAPGPQVSRKDAEQ
jgi:uncharacterized membrane protein